MQDTAGTQPNSEQTFQVTLKTLDVFDPDFFSRIKSREFTLWLVNTGGHWVSIILHVQGGKVVNYAIIEPERVPDVINLVDGRLRRLLAIGGVEMIPSISQIKDIWFPTQQDGFSCGLRTYEILRVMIERINERYHLHGVDKIYDESLWDAMSGDFQPNKVRQLMMGIVACRAMKHQDYKARLTVTPREKIRGFKGPRYVRRLDAFDGLEPVQRQQGIAAPSPQTRRRAKRLSPDANEDMQDVSGIQEVADHPMEDPTHATRSATSGPHFGFLS